MDLENTLNTLLINNENNIMSKNVNNTRGHHGQAVGGDRKKVFGNATNQSNASKVLNVLKGSASSSALTGKEDLQSKIPLRNRGFGKTVNGNAAGPSIARPVVGKQLSAPSEKLAQRPATRLAQEEVQQQKVAPIRASADFDVPSYLEPVVVPPGVRNIDFDDNDPQLVSEYVNDIYNYMRHLEASMELRSQFLDQQREMTHKMRSILVDWVINVQSSFKLLPETLYLSISIMDRFFQRENVAKDKIQLVGVTACWIASKIEEIYPPDVSDYVVICDKLYTKRDIIKCEMAILKTLSFRLCRPLPLYFLRRNSKAIHADSRIHSLAKYVMESTLVDYATAHWAPSLLGAASLYFTTRLIATDRVWDQTMHFYSGYSEAELRPCAAIITRIMQGVEKSRFQSCRKKYSSDKMLGVSKCPQLSAASLEEVLKSFE